MSKNYSNEILRKKRPVGMKKVYMRQLTLSAKELLTTTRAVRIRLDLTRPVEREVIEECITIAQQAPTTSNMQNWHFVIVTDDDKKAALAELFRRGW